MAHSVTPKASTHGHVAREGHIRQGRSATASSSAPKTRRSVVVPCAPTSGNRLLAKAAPTCTDTMAPSRAATGIGATARVDGLAVDVMGPLSNAAGA